MKAILQNWTPNKWEYNSVRYETVRYYALVVRKVSMVCDLNKLSPGPQLKYIKVKVYNTIYVPSVCVELIKSKMLNNYYYY